MQRAPSARSPRATSSMARRHGLLGALCTVVLLAAAWSPLGAATADELSRLAAAIDAEHEQQRLIDTAWQAERQRLELLAQTLRDERVRHDQAIATAQAELARRQAVAEAAEAATKIEQQFAAAVTRLINRIDQARAVWRQRTHLALITRPDTTPITGPGTSAPALASALEGLLSDEQASRAITVTRVVGHIGPDTRRAAEVLVVGGAAAWWLADDAGGTVHVRDGAIWFEASDDQDQLNAIATAFAIASADHPAQLVLLPWPEPAATP